MTCEAVRGRTLVIANPAAQSGRAREIAGRLQRFLEMYLRGSGSFEVVFTERPRHAVDLARSAAGFDSVLALGGDGVVHETANGIMSIPGPERPALGVVPVGSGNDYARTLGMREISSDADLAQVLNLHPRRIDVGRVRYTAESAPASPLTLTEHFVETLSFGLDAAIGLGTMSLRRRTGLSGRALYTLSGLEVFGARYREYPAVLSLDRGDPMRLRTLICAVQIGPTYGSGFLVTPDADPADGLLDICYAEGPLPRALALPLFLSAKNGAHVESRHIALRRAGRIDIELAGDGYPIQVDGERLSFRRAVVDVLPGALTVLAPDEPQAAVEGR